MGTYISTAEAIEMLGPQVYHLLDVAEGSDISANTTLLRAITIADDTINDHLRGRYSLPLSDVPASLAAIAADIVRYRLVQRRVEVVSEEDRRVYEDAIRQLVGYRDGKTQLTFPPEHENHDNGEAGAVLESTMAEVGDSSRVTGQCWFKNF